MSLERTSDDARLLAPFEETRAQKRISVYDRRAIDGEDIIVETSGLDYNQFLRFITEANYGFISNKKLHNFNNRKTHT